VNWCGLEAGGEGELYASGAGLWTSVELGHKMEDDCLGSGGSRIQRLDVVITEDLLGLWVSPARVA